ncbi:MAG: diacylglycerol kinase family lipid kinase [Dehalococcoidales bacterium]|nr:MAG: diacylglycerol kinase family lipid kinase [Dehalococcoidales bacterium]
MSVPYAKVIVNPVAGANATRRRWPRISRLLKKVGLSFDYQYTEGVGHAIEIAREAAGYGYRYLVAVGGDGTTNEVANGIIDSTGDGSIALGVVSTGTGSDFARSLGISRHYINACSSLVNCNTVLIDVGVVEYQHDGQTLRRFFINSAGIGFDAAAVQTTERLPKYFGGTLPYLIGLLRTLAGYRNQSVVITADDRVETARILSVVVANGGYFGGGMHVAPEASLSDNLLDLVVFGDVSKFDLLKSLPMVYKGTHGQHPKVRIGKADRVTIEASEESSEHILVQADGELLGEGPVSFSLVPAKLNVIV